MKSLPIKDYNCVLVDLHNFMQCSLIVSIAVLTCVRHSFDLSPTRREALKLAPFPAREGGWGLGLTVPRSAENRYTYFP